MPGFDTHFLEGHALEIPQTGAATRGDIVPTIHGDPVRHCEHFSLSLSASRRLCRWVAWNIDLAQHVPTTGDQRDFDDDPLYLADQQILGGYYLHNDLDQGHIAAFADVSWGDPEEARLARAQSCYFSNITPQLDSFNRSSMRGIWGEIENAINDGHDVDGKRLSVFGGPVLATDDPAYNGVQVPRDFWKVVAYGESATLKAKAFVITQKNLDERLRPLLEEYRLYQHRLADLAERLDLDFGGALLAADTAPEPRRAIDFVSPVRRIDSIEEVDVAGW